MTSAYEVYDDRPLHACTAPKTYCIQYSCQWSQLYRLAGWKENVLRAATFNVVSFPMKDAEVGHTCRPFLRQSLAKQVPSMIHPLPFRKVHPNHSFG